MKRDKIIYWVSTGILSVMMLFSAFSYLTNEEIKLGFEHMGFPDFFRIELAVAKILGAIVLLIPNFNSTIKQFAFFGFFLSFVSAFITHLSIGDPILAAIMPLVFIGLLALAYVYNNKMQQLKLAHSSAK